MIFSFCIYNWKYIYSDMSFNNNEKLIQSFRSIMIIKHEKNVLVSIHFFQLVKRKMSTIAVEIMIFCVLRLRIQSLTLHSSNSISNVRFPEYHCPTIHLTVCSLNLSFVTHYVGVYYFSFWMNMLQVWSLQF